MRTFVLGGGGNRGPLEVGAVRVLLEHGIVPEMIVGSSAGALNGAMLALSPTVERTHEMQRLWVRAGERKLIDGSPLRSLFQLVRGARYISDNRALKRWILRRALPEGKATFGDLAIPLYVTISHLRTHSLYVYGDDPRANLADAVVTSAAVPGFFPPTVVHGEVFADGGVVSNLPVRLALARGATEIWAIDLAFSHEHAHTFDHLLNMVDLSVKPVLYDVAIRELREAAQTPGITVHHIPIYDFPGVALGDFTRVNKMVEAGARAMRAYLANPRPNEIQVPRQWSSQELPAGPPGSRPFAERGR
ncbi:MAG: patatin-like phospholipase family protein [Thermoflexales bacterium]|nr:patatin-like phospholipase family protein [Thermoflexales bacterium]